MSNKTLTEWINSREDGGRTFAQEQLIVAVTERIWECMEEQGKTKAELASALSRSKAYVTQVLNGSRNMTLRTLADFAHALGCTPEIVLAQRASSEWTAVHSVGAFRPRIYLEDAPMVLPKRYRLIERYGSEDSHAAEKPHCEASNTHAVAA